MMRGGLAAMGNGRGSGAGERGWGAGAYAHAALRPDLLLLVIAAIILTYVWRFQNVFTAAQVLRPTLLFGLAVLVACVRLSPSHVASRLRSPVLGLLLVLVAVAAMGLPFALDPAGGRQYLLTWVAPGVLLAFLVAVSVRNAEDVEWLGLATLTGAGAYLAVLYARGGVNAPTNPAATVFYDRNDLSLILVALLPVALHLVRRGHRPLGRAIAAVCIPLFLFTVVRGGSRGGLVGLVVVLGYAFMTLRAVPRRTRIWTAVAAAALLAAAGPAYWARMGTILDPQTDYNWSERAYGRRELWRRGFQYIRARPLVGVGANGFPVAERDWSRPARARAMVGRTFETLSAHNVFIQVAAELGLPGLAAFVALLVAMARTLARLRRRYNSDARLAGLAHALLASLLGYVVCALFLSAAYFPFLYLLIGLVAAVGLVAGPELVPLPPRPHAAWRPPQTPTVPPRPPAPPSPPYERPAPARW